MAVAEVVLLFIGSLSLPPLETATVTVPKLR